jgi:hypothetical protein
MELDDLKAGWATLDQRLARLEERVAATTSDARRTGVRAELRPLVVGQVIQIVFGVLLALAAGAFWFDHRHEPNLLVTGLLLHAYGLAAIVAAGRNLFLTSRVNEVAPVVELQRRVAALRAWRIREGRWFGVVGCFMWVAMVIWGFGLLGVDLVAVNPLFVGLQVICACVCLGVFVLVTRLDKAPEGSAVRRARERLDEISEFEAA